MLTDTKWKIPNKDLINVTTSVLARCNFSGTPDKVTKDYLEAFNKTLNTLIEYNKTAEGTL